MKTLKYLEKMQVGNDNYILYSPDSLFYITDNMCDILDEKIGDLKSLFKIDMFGKIQINLFDDKEKFRNFIYELRGEKESLPNYASGTYDNGMINAYIEKDLLVDSSEYNEKICMASHELFHIMFLELILKNDCSNRIVWFDEGMAQNFSGEKDYLLDKEQFKAFCMQVKDNTKLIPNLNNLVHGDSFCTENYNGYDLCYLAVRYLIDTLTLDELYSLMSNFNEIKNIGNNILEKAFKYYS